MKTFTLETNAETAAYDYLSRLSSDRWAWEYARRNDDLRDDAAHRSDDDISEKKADCADKKDCGDKKADCADKKADYGEKPSESAALPMPKMSCCAAK